MSTVNILRNAFAILILVSVGRASAQAQEVETTESVVTPLEISSALAKVDSTCGYNVSALSKAADRFLEACFTSTLLGVQADEKNTASEILTLARALVASGHRPKEDVVTMQVTLGSLALRHSSSTIEFGSHLKALQEEIGTDSPIQILCPSSNVALPELDELIATATAKNPTAVIWAKRMSNAQFRVCSSRAELKDCESRMFSRFCCREAREALATAISQLNACQRGYANFLSELHSSIKDEYQKYQQLDAAATAFQATPALAKELSTSSIAQYDGRLIDIEALLISIDRYQRAVRDLNITTMKKLMSFYHIRILCGTYLQQTP